MLEIPEAQTIARQVHETLKGSTVTLVRAASSPHKFAWYEGDPVEYSQRLVGNTILSATAWGGMLEIRLTKSTLVFSDGVNLRHHAQGEALPQKQQLLLQFDDGSAMSASVQMYGGLLCWQEGKETDNPYYLGSKSKVSPLAEAFDEEYFQNLLSSFEVQSLSAKAALATQQRIPGLGNGVLQDILWTAGINPRRKINTLSKEEIHTLYASLKKILSDMTNAGGRDSEKDLFGNPGGYRTVMSAANKDKPCPKCGTPIFKEAYLGGSVYYCKLCQPF